MTFRTIIIPTGLVSTLFITIYYDFSVLGG